MPEPELPAAAPPVLRLLGCPELVAHGRRTAFTGERPFQLLAYLACKGEWVRRDELADLLYPGRDIEAARSNLRKVVLLARRLLGGERQGEGESTIEHHGELLRWQPDSDLKRFERACDEGRFADALVLYGGALLHGMDSGWPGEAAEWLAGERSRLEGRWRDAALRELRALRERGCDPAAAEALAHELLRHDAHDDEAMQALLEAQRRQGRAGEARQALQAYATRLAASFGLEPSVALQQLGRAVGHDGPVSVDAPPAATTVAAELIGRRHELAQVARRLTGSEARLLTLLGQGGIGKTALARAALEQLRAHFAAGAAWVDLEPIDLLAAVPARAAAAFPLAIDTRPDSWAALAEALGKGPSSARLLVLDNAETLAADPAFAVRITALLQAVPALRILVTSRIALGAPGEWRLPLDGLPLPDADERVAEVLLANDAVRLFVRHALPLAPGFSLAAEAKDVVELVREVEGLPLAICLLAAWRRLMPVREILADLRGSLDVLEPSAPHERSVRAAFERGWQQLTPLQQRVLGQLALLPQPVDREMLRAVLHAPLPVVASLVDRSLVRADGDGRFSLHALIRRLAAPRASDGAALLARHAHHMAQRERHPTRQLHTVLMTAMADEIEHHRAAWRWALQAQSPALLKALVAPLTVNDHERGPLGHMLPTLGEAAVVLEGLVRRQADRAPGGEASEALARVLLAMGTTQVRLGRLDEAAHNARRVLVMAEAGLRDSGLLADALITLFNVHWRRRELPEAEALVRRYQAAAQASGDPTREAYGHTLAGLTHAEMGHHDEALRSYEAARALHVQLGDTASLPRLLSSLGHLLCKMRRPREAVGVLEEGLRWARRHAVAAAQPSLLTNLAIAYEDLGDAPAMVRASERALELARQTNEPYALIRALLVHARALAARDGDLAQASEPVWKALREAEKIGIGWERQQCLISAALVAARCGRSAQAARVLRWVLAQPGLPPQTQLEGRRALEEAVAQAGADEAGGDAGLTGDAAVEDVLRLLGPEPGPGASDRATLAA